MGDLFLVRTTHKNYFSKKLVVTSGAWTGKLLHELNIPLKITRQLLVWVMPENPERYTPEKFPCWMIADDNREGALYGFPHLPQENFGEPQGLKFGWHHPDTLTGPDNVNRSITQKEIEEL